VQYQHPEVINLALLLPLNLGNIDQIDINNNSVINQRYFAYASALEAVLLALKNYEESPENQKVALYIYDVSDENSAKKLTLSGKLQKDKINVMIGPVFLKSFEWLADYARKNNILIINPLSDKEFLKHNHLTVKANTSEEKILQQIIQDALNHDSTASAKDLILIYDSLPEHINQCDFVKKSFSGHPYFANIKEINIYNSNIQNLNKVLSEKNKNILLYLSDNEAFLSQIISNTSKQKSEKKLYCTKFFDVFNQQELKYMEAIDLRYATLFCKNRDDEAVRNFEKQFYAKFNTLPDANAFLFYDLTNMVIKSVYTTQKEQLSLENIKYEGLGYSFYFLRQNLLDENGLENIQIRIVQPAL
jgi:adenylate kinase family enzyme